MRISDWSSDVCSSDLSATDRETLSHPLAGQVWDLLNKRYPQRPFGLDGSLQLDLGIDSLEWVTLSLEIERRPIGRASCRERVCPYVSISVVAVSFKINNLPFSLFFCFFSFYFF